MLTRRALLISGTATATVIAGGAAGLTLLSRPRRARMPWKAAGESFGDVRLDALAFAILAPSPHNMQPWQIRLDGEDTITLFCDLDRLLPETDPLNRQITIGFGCFLELLRMAVAESGIRTDVVPFPDGVSELALDHRPVARIRFVADSTIARDPLFAHALARRTNRETFNADTFLPQTRLDAVLDRFARTSPSNGIAVSGTVDADKVRELRDLCHRGWAIEGSTPETLAESARLMRIGARAIDANPDGLALSGPAIELLARTGLMTNADMAIPGSASAKKGDEFYFGLTDTAQGFLWLATSGNRRTDQLTAGAAWLQLHMTATAEGIAFQPLSQVLQEFPAMAALLAKAHASLGVAAPARLQGLFRIGEAPAPAASPRWPLEAKLIAS